MQVHQIRRSCILKFSPIPCLSISAIKSASVSSDGGDVSPWFIYNESQCVVKQHNNVHTIYQMPLKYCVCVTGIETGTQTILSCVAPNFNLLLSSINAISGYLKAIMYIKFLRLIITDLILFDLTWRHS